MSKHTPQKPIEAPLPHGITVEEIMAGVHEARKRVVEPMLGTSLASRFADDVVSEVAMAVWKQVRDGVYDPEKSPLRSWIRLISRRRSLDVLKKVYNSNSYASEMLLKDDPDRDVEGLMEEILHRADPEVDTVHAQMYAEIEADKMRTHPILIIGQQVMNEPKFWLAWNVFFKFDEDIAEAARVLHQDPQHLRACVRLFKVMLRVIYLALEARKTGSIGSIDDLIGCLPETDEAGGHRRRIAEAIRLWASHGHPISEITVEFVVSVTGDSYNTIRQRLGEVQQLLSAALTVMTRLEFASEEDVATAEEQGHHYL